MNNSNVHSSPPMDSYESSEVALMDSFKAAALTVTTLYKDSLVQNRKAYVSGYQQALQDLYEFISSHPTLTTASQQQNTVISPTDGHLPVQDLLTYARQRNDQLPSEMGVDLSASLSSSAPSPPQQPQQLQSTSYTNISPNSFDTNVRSQHSSNSDSQLTHLGCTDSSATVTNPSDTVDDNMDTAAAVKNAFHPFQIDPDTQFTFSLPVNKHTPRNNGSNMTTSHHQYHPHHRSRNHHQYHHYYHHAPSTTPPPPQQQQHYNNGNNDTSNNIDHIEDMNEDDGGMNDLHLGNTFSGFPTTTKRRFTQQELTFMGRTLNNMNIDSTWNEPPLKRRSKKDDLM